MRKLKFICDTITAWFQQGWRNLFTTTAANHKPRRSSGREAERLDRLRNPSKYLGNDSGQLPGPVGPENRAS